MNQHTVAPAANLLVAMATDTVLTSAEITAVYLLRRTADESFGVQYCVQLP